MGELHGLQASARSAGVILRTVSAPRRTEARQSHLRPHLLKNMPVVAGLCATLALQHASEQSKIGLAPENLN